MKTIQLNDKQLFELKIILSQQLESAQEDIEIYGANVHESPCRPMSKHVVMLESIIKAVQEAK